MPSGQLVNERPKADPLDDAGDVNSSGTRTTGCPGRHTPIKVGFHEKLQNRNFAARSAFPNRFYWLFSVSEKNASRSSFKDSCADCSSSFWMTKPACTIT